MLFLFLTPPLNLLTHILLHSLSLSIYIYTTLNFRMTEHQSKCRFLVPVILTPKKCFKENRITPHFSRVRMGDIWSFDEIWRILIFFIIYHPWLDVHSHSQLTSSLSCGCCGTNQGVSYNHFTPVVFKPNYKFLSNYLVVFCFLFFELFFIKL